MRCVRASTQAISVSLAEMCEYSFKKWCSVNQAYFQLCLSPTSHNATSLMRRSCSAVVTQVRARNEGARFDSDVFLISDGVLPAETVEAAQVMTTRVDPEVYVPPLPGSPVHRAVGEERDLALSFDQMESRLPIGLG